MTIARADDFWVAQRTGIILLARRRLRPARRIRQFDRAGCRTAGFSRLAYGGTEDLMRGECLGAISILRLLFHWGMPVKRILFKILQGRGPALSSATAGSSMSGCQCFSHSTETELLVRVRPYRRRDRAFGSMRCHDDDGFAGATGQDRGVQQTHGLAPPVGVLIRQRLQLTSRYRSQKRRRRRAR